MRRVSCTARAERTRHTGRAGRVRRVLTLGFVALAALVLGMPPASAAAADVATPAPAPSSTAVPARAAWTVALFVNADNDLDYCWPRFTRPALKALPANDQVNVVAMVDRPGKAGGVRLVQISGREVRTVARWPERDFGSGKTLEWFLKQVTRRFPADHLVVSLWDHGYGWRYVSRDDTSGGARITMPELRRALQGAGVPIDILSFDACNMAGVEVLYQIGLTGLVDYVVASEETIDQDGIPFDGALGPLMADPGRAPRDVAADMVAAWRRYYRPLRCFSWVSLSALDVRAVMRARADLRAWVASLRAGLPRYRARYAAALRRSIYAWDSWHVDLADVATRLAADPAITDAGLRSLSATVADDARAAVVALDNGSYASAFGGMTLWWGTGRDWRRYRAAYRPQVAFARQIGWHRFLREYNACVGRGPARPPEPKLARARYGLTDVTFTDADHGWVAGYDNDTALALIARTTDGGQHWKVTGPAWWYSYTVSALSFLDGKRGWAVGGEGYDGSLLLKTTDGGRSWSWRRGRTAEYLLGVDALSGKRVWVVGSRGTRLLSTDGGRRWNGTRRASRTDLWSVDFADAAHGWLAGGDSATGRGVMRHTDDGGATWTRQTTVEGSILYEVEALDATRAWAVGGDPAGGAGVVLRTTDGGQSWETSWGGPRAPCLGDVTFLDAVTGWAVGEGGTVLRTVDGGESWEPVAVPTTQDLTAVSFTDAANGWIVGDGTVMLHTSDGGQAWTTTTLDLK